MTIYQHAREFAQEIMKTEEAVRYYSLKDNIGDTNSVQYEESLHEYNNLVNELFSIIKYTIGEEDILESKPDESHNCGGCKNQICAKHTREEKV